MAKKDENEIKKVIVSESNIELDLTNIDINYLTNETNIIPKKLVNAPYSIDLRCCQFNNLCGIVTKEELIKFFLSNEKTLCTTDDFLKVNLADIQEANLIPQDITVKNQFDYVSSIIEELNKTIEKEVLNDENNLQKINLGYKEKALKAYDDAQVSNKLSLAIIKLYFRKTANKYYKTGKYHSSFAENEVSNELFIDPFKLASNDIYLPKRAYNIFPYYLSLYKMTIDEIFKIARKNKLKKMIDIFEISPVDIKVSIIKEAENIDKRIYHMFNLNKALDEIIESIYNVSLFLIRKDINRRNIVDTIIQFVPVGAAVISSITAFILLGIYNFTLLKEFDARYTIRFFVFILIFGIIMSYINLYRNTKIYKKRYKRALFQKVTSFVLDGFYVISLFLMIFFINRYDGYNDEFYYVYNNSGITIDGLRDKKIKSYVLPKEIDSLNVTELSNYTFKKNKYVISVNIDSNIDKIEEKAFYKCNKLVTVKLNTNIKTIEEKAFYKCSSLKNINLDNIETISEKAFSECSFNEIKLLNCKNLNHSSFEDTSINYLSIVLSNDILNELSYYFTDLSLNNLIITSNNEIDLVDNYLKNIKNLSSITINGTFNSIGNYAFSNLDSLKSVKINGYVNEYKSYVFKNDSRIETITINNNTTKLGEGMFSGCYNIKELTVPFIGKDINNSDTYPLGFLFGKEKYINSYCVCQYNNTNNAFQTQTYFIPAKLCTINIIGSFDIPESAFKDCTSIKYINLNSQISYIGKEAFTYSGLKTFICPTNLELIEEKTFSDCIELTSITFNDKIQFIGEEAFANTHSLSAVNFPASLKIIDKNAFNHSTISTIYFGNKINQINDYAFNNTSISNVYFDGNILDFMNIEFKSPSSNPIKNANLYLHENNSSQYTKLQNINISYDSPIGDYQFYQYTYLRSVVIDGNIEEIGKQAFYNNTQLTLFNVNGSIKVISDSAFEKCSSLSQFSFSDNLETIGKNAFSNCKNMSNIILPDNINIIDDYAFSDNNLLSIVLPLNARYIGKGVLKNSPSIKIISVPFVGMSPNSNNTFGYLFDGSNNSYSYQTIVNSASSYYIPNSLTTINITGSYNIPSYAFAELKKVSYIDLNNEIISIGSSAFKNCYELLEISIPNVEIINNELFSNCYKLSNLTISNNLVSIGDYAFYNCDEISTINLPNSLIYIGCNAFYDCDLINNIIIPNTINKINDYMFYNCKSLSNITFGTNIEEISESAFEYCSILNTSIPESVTKIGPKAFASTNITNVIIPENIVILDNETFRDCILLSSVTFNNNLKEIGSSVFKNCTNLSDITLPSNLKTIGGNAFRNTHLINITIPNSIDFLGNNIFEECNYIESIILPFVGNSLSNQSALSYLFTDKGNDYIPNSLNSITLTKTDNIIDSMFKNCIYLSEINLYSQTKIIENYAFQYCYSLRSIDLPNTITTIGQKVFSYCSNLETIDIPNSVNTIGENILESCLSIKSVSIPFVGKNKQDNSSRFENLFGASYYSNSYYGYNSYIPNSLESINITNASNISNYCFDGLYTVKSISINNNVDSIGSYAFRNTNISTITLPNISMINTGIFKNCSSLSSLVIPDTVTKIGDEAFYCCSKLNSINIPTSVISLGNYCFSYCIGLQNLTMSTNTKTIGKYAFISCQKLSSIDLPNNLETIESGCFSYCTLLSDIPLNNIKYINDDAFSHCYSLSTVVLPNGLLSIGNSAFDSCSSLVDFTIPNSTTSIGEHIFANCYNLETLTIPFVGSTSTDNDNKSIGYLFKNEYNSNMARITQFRINENSNQTEETYYVPYLKTINITGTSSIPVAAFMNLAYVEQINLNSSIKSIGSYAFYGCLKLETLNIPNDITMIDKYTFYNCEELSNISLGNKINTIGEYSFYNTNINEIQLPQSLKTIEQYAFSMCSNLYELIVPSGATSIGTSIIAGDKSINTVSIPFVGNKKQTDVNSDYYPFSYIFGLDTREEFYSVTQASLMNGRSSSYKASIPNSLVNVSITNSNYIPKGSFSYLTSLINVNLCSSIDTIGENAFYSNQRLENINLENVTTINSNAFYSCYKLNSLSLNNLNTVGNRAFYSCSTLKTLNSFKPTEIAAEAFAYCNSLESIDLSNVSIINKSTFFGCSSLKNIEHIDNISKVAESAFSGCVLLNNINFSNSLKEIGKYAFQNCTSLIHINIGNTCTSIDTGAFKYCTSLEAIIIPNSVSSISNALFEGCTNIKSISVPFIGKSIDDTNNSFGFLFGTTFIDNCYSAKQSTQTSLNYYIPSSLEEVIITSANFIPNYSFMNMNKVISFTLNSNVTSIGNYAFYSCSSLESINLPDNIKNINNYAFYNTSLQVITLPNDLINLGNYSLSNIAQLNNINFNLKLKTIGEYSFKGDIGLTTVQLPNSLESIGSSSFNGCYNLSSISVPFVGNTKTSNERFGFIFGTASYQNSYSSYHYIDKLNYYIPTSLKTISITGEYDIPSYAFYSLINVTDFDINNEISCIGTYAFAECDSLISIALPKIEAVSNSLLYGCNKLETVSLSSVTKYIGSYSFYNSELLDSINLNNIETIGSYAFSYCCSIKNINPLNNLVSVGNNAFEFTSLENITLPSTLKTIGKHAFKCTNIKQLIIPSSVTSLGFGMLYSVDIESLSVPFIGETISSNKFIGYIFGSSIASQSNTYVPNTLTEFILQNTVKDIESYGLTGLSNIKSLNIPNSVQAIKENALYGLNSLEELSIPFIGEINNSSESTNYPLGYIFGKNNDSYNVATYQEYINENGLVTGETYYVPTSLKVINITLDTIVQHGSFMNMKNLTNIVLSNNTLTISKHSFKNCTGLTGLVIPDSVITIEEEALNGCSGLKSLSIPFVGNFKSTLDNQDYNTFGFIFGSTQYNQSKEIKQYSKKTNSEAEENTYYIPDGLIEVNITNESILAEYSFYGMTGLKKIFISDDISRINSKSFAGFSDELQIEYEGNSSMWTNVIKESGWDGFHISLDLIYLK